MANESAGKTRNAARTRAAILAAAQSSFASKGYGQTGMREIAAEADVDPALISRYFGSKKGLFAAAIADALDIAELIDTTRSDFGAHVVEFLMSEPDGRSNPLPMLMMAMADPEVRPIALEQLNARVIAPLSEWIGGPDAAQRAARVSMLCSGFLTYVRMLPIEVFAEGVDPKTRAWLKYSLQAAVDA